MLPPGLAPTHCLIGRKIESRPGLPDHLGARLFLLRLPQRRRLGELLLNGLSRPRPTYPPWRGLDQMRMGNASLGFVLAHTKLPMWK